MAHSRMCFGDANEIGDRLINFGSRHALQVTRQRPALSTCRTKHHAQIKLVMRTSIAARANLELIDENYERWQEDPRSVDPSWSAFFEGFELGNVPEKDGAVAAARDGQLQTRVDGLIYAYRTLGHTIARTNPLAEARPQNPMLSLRELGFSDKDLDLPVSSKFFLDNEQMALREMIARLEKIYAGSIGAEFMHIQNNRIRNWVRYRLESRPDKHSTPRQVTVALLGALMEAESFERLLHSR